MTLELLTNVFGHYADDPQRRNVVAQRMRATGAFTTVLQLDAWTIGISAFERGPTPPASLMQRGVVLVQAPPGLVGDEQALGALADRLRTRPDTLAEVPGDVAAAAFGDGVVTLMSPVAGRVPWYSSVRDGELAVGTRLAYFFHLFDRTEQDPFGLAAATCAQVFPDGRTPLRGVLHLLPGRYVRIDLGGSSEPSRYWHPPTASTALPTTESSDRAAAELKAALVAALERELDPEGGNLLGLSGGVDSSSLAALTVRSAGRPLATFSHLPSWESTHPDMAIDYIGPLVAELGIEQAHMIPLDAERYVEAHDTAPRVALPVPHQALGHLREIAAATDARILTGGELADDLFGGADFIRLDWLASFSLTQLARRVGVRGLRDGHWRRSVVKPWFEGRVRRWTRRPELPVPADLPEWFADDVRAEYRAWHRRYGAAVAATRARYLHVAAVLDWDGWLAMNWEVCSALGIRRSVPFVTRDVIEVALRCHPQEHAHPTKRLIRRGLADVVPALNLNRPDKGYFGAEADRPTTEWNDDLPEPLRPLLRADWFPRPPRALDLDEVSVLRTMAHACEAPVLIERRSTNGVDR